MLTQCLMQQRGVMLLKENATMNLCVMNTPVQSNINTTMLVYMESYMESRVYVATE